jgi:hypothetical protein
MHVPVVLLVWHHFPWLSPAFPTQASHVVALSKGVGAGVGGEGYGVGAGVGGVGGCVGYGVGGVGAGGGPHVFRAASVPHVWHAQLPE